MLTLDCRTLLSFAATTLLLGLCATAAGAADLLGPDDFEVDFGSWANATGDDFDWTRDSGGTPSNGTGPSGDHTTGSGFYVYTETSSPRVAGDLAQLDSPCIDLTLAGSADWEFWYHLNGAAMGTLRAQIASSTGATCSALGAFADAFTISGDQGDVWTQQIVALPVGGSVVLRFEGERGSSFTGDMALDDVVVTSPCTSDLECSDGASCTDDVCNLGTGQCENPDICTGGLYCNVGANLCEVPPENVLVVDADTDALIRIDPLTGDRTVISGCVDVGCTSQVGAGPSFVFLRGVVPEDDGNLLVCEGFLGDPSNQQSILRVDPATGDRTVVSSSLVGSEVGTGPAFDTLFDIILDANGDILVADTEIDTVFRVDPVTGDRTIVTSNTVGTGPAMSFPGDLALEASGDILMTEGSNDQVVRVDPATGDRTVVSDAVTGTGPIWTNLGGILVEADGNIVVCDVEGLFRIDPVTGDRALVSGATMGAGPLFGANLFACHADAAGTLYVIDETDNLYSVDPVTGDRTIVASPSLGSGIAPANMRDVRVEGAICGNGTLETGEQCDDGNNDPGDCCSAVCEFESAATVCRASADVCDAAETCTGSSGTCPADGFEPPTTECRASADVCDVAETCTGASAACPADGFEAPTTECRAPAGVCDVAELCTGSGAACPADGFEAPTTECRVSAGVCDVAELCTGSDATCPADGFASAATLCRASADVCDVAELCTGAGPACPADGFEPPTTECRAAADVCDVAELCTGTGAACPADVFESAATECRAAAGDCDVAEQCTGTGAACPADGFEPPTTECRAAAGVCDVAELCTGGDPNCPVDDVLDGVPCLDGDVCNGDETCQAGVCVAGTTLDCDDGNICTADSCDEILGCAHDPIMNCGPGTVLPASSDWGLALLVLLMTMTGALVADKKGWLRS